MGRDKAWLEIGGKSLLARQIELGRAMGATEVFISGRADADYSALGCRVLQDRFPNAGPLAGIEKALEVMTTEMLLVLAVDMPELNGDFLKKLRAVCRENSGAIPQIRGRLEPLAAFYPKAAGQLAEAMLANNRAGLEPGAPGPTDFARACVRKNLAQLVETSAAEARYFSNWNSPEDLRAS
jgi:molybdopterin-guanine dinucleotide biosynthesis protein A